MKVDRRLLRRAPAPKVVHAPAAAAPTGGSSEDLQRRIAMLEEQIDMIQTNQYEGTSAERKLADARQHGMEELLSQHGNLTKHKLNETSTCIQNEVELRLDAMRARQDQLQEDAQADEEREDFDADLTIKVFALDTQCLRPGLSAAASRTPTGRR